MLCGIRMGRSRSKWKCGAFSALIDKADDPAGGPLFLLQHKNRVHFILTRANSGVDYQLIRGRLPWVCSAGILFLALLWSPLWHHTYVVSKSFLEFGKSNQIKSKAPTLSICNPLWYCFFALNYFPKKCDALSCNKNAFEIRVMKWNEIKNARNTQNPNQVKSRRI